MVSYPRLANARTNAEQRIAVSQDGKHIAFASTFEDVDFWGHRTFYYQFDIHRKNESEPFRSIRMYPPTNEPLTDFSEMGDFSWSSDSLGVEIGVFGIEVRMQAIDLDE